VEHNNVKYVFEKELGSGAFGKVYLYRHPMKPDDKIAIKIEKPNTNCQLTNESYYTRILNDQYSLTCIPKYYGDHFYQSRSYIKIEYIDSTIEKYLDTPNLPGKIGLVKIARDLLRAFEAFHNADHLHRDVKPDNFLISTKDHKVRLIDLGLVINYKPEGVHRARGRYNFQGTPYFGSIDVL
jgi:serine/threonine protein kinase